MGPRKKQFTIPLAVVAGFLPVVKITADAVQRQGSWPKAIAWTGGGLVGWDTENNRWAGISQMRKAGTPSVVLGFAVHYLAGKLGINRMLARSGIPFVRI